MSGYKNIDPDASFSEHHDAKLRIHCAANKIKHSHFLMDAIDFIIPD